jgi:hypothetical protein
VSTASKPLRGYLNRLVTMKVNQVMMKVNHTASCHSRHKLAAKNAIAWPLSTTIQAQTRLLATQHNLAESARIKQFLAESAHLENGFHWLLMRFQRLTASTTYYREQDLSVKTQIGNCQKSQFLAEAANLCRKSHKCSCLRAKPTHLSDLTHIW